MIYSLNLNEGKATAEQKFLALGGCEVHECGMGVVTFYRGTALNSVGPIQQDDNVDLNRKEYCLYQEFTINENSPI